MGFTYGVSSWTYGAEDLATTAARVADAGLDGLEVAGWLDRFTPADVLDICGRHGLAVLSVCGMMRLRPGGPDLSSPHPGERAAAIDYYLGLCDFTAAVGAALIVCTPQPVFKNQPTQPASTVEELRAHHDAEWAWCAESLSIIARRASELGLAIALEPINRYEGHLVSTVAEGLAMADAVGNPAVGVHLDTYHMNIEEADPCASVARAAGRIRNVHVADNHRLTVGTGHFDFAGFIVALKAAGYDGSIVVETLPRFPNFDLAAEAWTASERDVDVRNSVDYLRRLEARALDPVTASAPGSA